LSSFDDAFRGYKVANYRRLERTADPEVTMATDQATVSQAIDLTFVEDFAESWLDAWNSQSAEKLFALMADDIVYDDAAWPTTMHGHTEVQPFLEHTWRAFPDLRFELVGSPLLAADEPRAAFYWRGYATHAGPIDPPGLAPTGKRMEIEGADFHEYRDGKLARLQIVFDMARAMRQLGALPEPGSRSERFAVGLANLQRRLGRSRS
jgi:steroid delta-isomerase-like uncharacterized protein